MGGQACVFYGAAEFSRDLDLLVLADASSLNALRAAMASLDAETIAVPHLDGQFLQRGHAVHFRCRREDVKALRIDVMSKLRGSNTFVQLWSRRTTIEVEGIEIDMLSLPDLVVAKKTQRDKDWPMIRRLVEQAYFSLPRVPDENSLEFLFLELRTPELLIRLANQFPDAAQLYTLSRVPVARALEGNIEEVSAALSVEEAAERGIDRAYWKPLKLEIEQLRRSRVKHEDE